MKLEEKSRNYCSQVDRMSAVVMPYARPSISHLSIYGGDRQCAACICATTKHSHRPKTGEQSQNQFPLTARADTHQHTRPSMADATSIDLRNDSIHRTNPNYWKCSIRWFSHDSHSSELLDSHYGTATTLIASAVSECVHVLSICCRCVSAFFPHLITSELSSIQWASR